MELVYSNQKSGFETGKTYRNPQHFERPELGVTSVTVIGDWPNVVAAHEEAGIEVEVIETPKVAIVGSGGVDPHIIEALRRELETVGVMVEGLAIGDLQKPEEGETAIRLFEELTRVSENFQSLLVERDGLIAERNKLTLEKGKLLADIQELKDAAAKQISDADEVDAMKAKLDAAGVSYRSNASKDSLEKLVADLPLA